MKISTKLVSASAVALLATSAATPVFATTSTTAQNAVSNGRIQLITGKDDTHPGGGDDGGDGTDPTDPSDPNYPNDGNGNDNTGNKGDFTLDVVPNYDFGIQTIDGAEHTYNALFWDSTKANDDGTTGGVVEGRNSNPYVQVTDLRENNSGWNVTVAMTKAFQTSAGKPLNGAILSLPAGTATPVDSTNTSSPQTNSEVKDVNATPAVLMSAAADGKSGIGSWMDTMFDNAANNTMATTLYVPAGNSAGKYQADLTWTLADAPK